MLSDEVNQSDEISTGVIANTLQQVSGFNESTEMIATTICARIYADTSGNSVMNIPIL
jgi:hypothetical protein